MDLHLVVRVILVLSHQCSLQPGHLIHLSMDKNLQKISGQKHCAVSFTSPWTRTYTNIRSKTLCCLIHLSMDKNLHKYQVKNTVLSHSSLHGQEPAQISGQKHCAVSFISPWTRTCTNIRSKTLCCLIHLSMDKNLHKYQVKNTVLSHSSLHGQEPAQISGQKHCAVSFISPWTRTCTNIRSKTLCCLIHLSMDKNLHKYQVKNTVLSHSSLHGQEPAQISAQKHCAVSFISPWTRTCTNIRSKTLCCLIHLSMDKNLHKYQVKNTVLSHSSLHGQEPAQISGQKHCAVSFISPWTRTCTNIRSKTLCCLIHLSMDKNLHKYQLKNTVLSHSSLHGQEPAQISAQKHCAVSFISPWTRTCTNIRSKTLCCLIHLSMDKNLHKYQVKNTVLSHSSLHGQEPAQISGQKHCAVSFISPWTRTCTNISSKTLCCLIHLSMDKNLHKYQVKNTVLSHSSLHGQEPAKISGQKHCAVSFISPWTRTYTNIRSKTLCHLIHLSMDKNLQKYQVKNTVLSHSPRPIIQTAHQLSLLTQNLLTIFFWKKKQ